MKSLLLPWLLLCASAVASEVHNITRRETGSGGGRRVVCYYTNWSVYRPGTAKFSPQNINPYLCTHIIYAFGGLTRENGLRPYDKYQDIEQGGYAKFTGLKTYNKNLKTILAIGGWNEGSARFSPLVADEERREEFVHNVVRFLRQNHFDGLDLDWEYPAFRDGGKPRDRENYALLVQELRAEFDRESSKTGRSRLLLTMAVPAGIEYIDKGYDIPKLNKYLDFMNILSYDYHSAFEPAVNHHAPLYPLEEDSEYNFDAQLSIDYTVGHYLKLGADREKLVLGIPTYGRSYTLFNPLATEIGAPADGPGEQGDATREKGYLAYYEICENIKSSDDWKVIQPNPTAMGPYAYKGNQWVGYDDIDIVKLKARYVGENGLGGIMFWAIDNDDFRGKCHGRPYPLIEAGKEALLATSRTSNEVVSVAPSSGSGKGKRPGKRGPSNSGGRQSSSQGRTHKRRPSRLKSPSTTTTTTTTTTTPRYDYGLTTPEPPTTPDPGSDFMCKDEGFFPHPRDCKKYFWCLDSGPSNLGIVAHQFTCPSGLFFNKAADSCDYARNVICKKKSSAGSSTKAPPITAATSRTTRLSTTTTTTTTTTTPEPEIEEEYDDEYENEEDAEEDPQVIKELINLIKKLGGVEQLEKQLHLQETGRAGSDTSDTAGISKSLYERVLSRNKERVFTTPKYTSLFRNRPVGPQNAGLDNLEEVQVLRREKPKYVTISRNRPSTPAPKEELDEDEALLDEDELEEDDIPDEEDAQEQHSKLPEYVTIRRQRPSSTTEEITTPKYVTIQRSRPKASSESPEPVEEEVTTTTTERPRPAFFSTPKIHVVTPSRSTRAPPKVQEAVEEEEEETTEQVSERYRPGTEEGGLFSGSLPTYVDITSIGRRRDTTSPIPEYELEDNLIVSTQSPRYKNVDLLTRRRESVSDVAQEPTTPLPTEAVITTPSTTRFTPTVTRVITSVTESGTTERQRIAVNRVPYLAIAAARGETVYPGPFYVSVTPPVTQASTEKVMEINRVTLVTAKEEVTDRMTTHLDVVHVEMDKISEVNRMKQVTVIAGVTNTTEEQPLTTELPTVVVEVTTSFQETVSTALPETTNIVITSAYTQQEVTTALSNDLEATNITENRLKSETVPVLTVPLSTEPAVFHRRRPGVQDFKRRTTVSTSTTERSVNVVPRGQQRKPLANGRRRRPFRGPYRTSSEAPAEDLDEIPKPDNSSTSNQNETFIRGPYRTRYQNKSSIRGPYRTSSEAPAEGLDEIPKPDNSSTSNQNETFIRGPYRTRYQNKSSIRGPYRTSSEAPAEGLDEIPKPDNSSTSNQNETSIRGPYRTRYQNKTSIRGPYRTSSEALAEGLDEISKPDNNTSNKNETSIRGPYGTSSEAPAEGLDEITKPDNNTTSNQNETSIRGSYGISSEAPAEGLDEIPKPDNSSTSNQNETFIRGPYRTRYQNKSSIRGPYRTSSEAPAEGLDEIPKPDNSSTSNQNETSIRGPYRTRYQNKSSIRGPYRTSSEAPAEGLDEIPKPDNSSTSNQNETFIRGPYRTRYQNKSSIRGPYRTSSEAPAEGLDEIPKPDNSSTSNQNETSIRGPYRTRYQNKTSIRGPYRTSSEALAEGLDEISKPDNNTSNKNETSIRGPYGTSSEAPAEGLDEITKPDNNTTSNQNETSIRGSYGISSEAPAEGLDEIPKPDNNITSNQNETSIRGSYRTSSEAPAEDLDEIPKTDSNITSNQNEISIYRISSEAPAEDLDEIPNNITSNQNETSISGPHRTSSEAPAKGLDEITKPDNNITSNQNESFIRGPYRTRYQNKTSTRGSYRTSSEAPAEDLDEIPKPDNNITSNQNETSIRGPYRTRYQNKTSTRGSYRTSSEAPAEDLDEIPKPDNNITSNQNETSIRGPYRTRYQNKTSIRGPYRTSSEPPAEGLNEIRKSDNNTTSNRNETSTRGQRKRPRRPYRLSTTASPVESPQAFIPKRRGSYRRRTTEPPTTASSNAEEASVSITEVRDISELLTEPATSTDSRPRYFPTSRRRNTSSSVTETTLTLFPGSTEDAIVTESEAKETTAMLETTTVDIGSTEQQTSTTVHPITSQVTSSTATTPGGRRRRIKKRRRRPTTNQNTVQENEVSPPHEERDILGITPFVTAALLEREDSTVRPDNHIASALEEQELTKAEESGYDRNLLHLAVKFSPHDKEHSIANIDVTTPGVSEVAETVDGGSTSSAKVTTTTPVSTTIRSPLRRPSSVTLYNRGRQRATTAASSTTSTTTEAPSSTASRRRRPAATRVVRRRKYNNGTRTVQDNDATASQVQTLDPSASDVPASGRVRKFSFPKRRTSTTLSTTAATIATTAPPPPPPPPPPVDDKELLESNEQQIQEQEDLPDLADSAVVAIHNLATAPSSAITTFPTISPSAGSTLRLQSVENTEQRTLISSTAAPFVAPTEAATKIRVPTSTPRLISSTFVPRRSGDASRHVAASPRTLRPFSRISPSSSTTVPSRPRPRPQPIAPIIDYDYYDEIDDQGADAVVAGILPASAGKVKIHSDGYIECLDRGNFPHPFSCKKFISCAKMENGELLGWEYTCPRQLSFDPIGGICNWSAGLGCKE